MNKYELMFIIACDVSEEKREELIAKQKAYVEAHKGNVEGIEKIGMKKLAYPINYETEGYYIVAQFESDENFPAEIDRVINITDGVLRSLIVAKGE